VENGVTEVVPQREELLEQREFLARSLRDLDAELAAGDIDDRDYVRLKERYTARADAVRRALEPPTGAQDNGGRLEVDRTRSHGPGRPRRRSAVVAASVALFAVLAGLLVAYGAGRRAPGSAITGSITATGVQDQLTQAQNDLGNGKYLDAVKLFDAVLRTDPRNPEALAYRGWILRLTGVAANDPSLTARGWASIQAAEAADPSYADAHFFAGEILLRDRHDGAGAAIEFRKVLSSDPPPALVPEVQGELQAALALTAPSTTRPPG
jgi:tetratricopeptide (TPR) repeat protein